MTLHKKYAYNMGTVLLFHLKQENCPHVVPVFMRGFHCPCRGIYFCMNEWLHLRIITCCGIRHLLRHTVGRFRWCCAILPVRGCFGLFSRHQSWQGHVFECLSRAPARLASAGAPRPHPPTGDEATPPLRDSILIQPCYRIRCCKAVHLHSSLILCSGI